MVDLDWYAIRLVVREGIRTVPLNREERIMAAHLMRAKGIDSVECATTLGTALAVVTRRLWGVEPPLPVQWVQEHRPEVIGSYRPRRPNMSKRALRIG